VGSGRIVLARNNTRLRACVPTKTHSERKVTLMNIDPKFVNQVLNKVPYPISKTQLIQEAQQLGVNPQVMSVLQRIPDKTYNSSQDLEKELKNLGIKVS
jgi:hypothetical protein